MDCVGREGRKDYVGRVGRKGDVGKLEMKEMLYIFEREGRVDCFLLKKD